MYDEYRTARFRKKCYATELKSLKRWNYGIEVTIAIFTPTSAIAGAGLFFFEITICEMIWEICIALAAILVIVKPIIRLSEKISNIKSTLAGYEMTENSLNVLRVSIKNSKEYNENMCSRFLEILNAKNYIVSTSYGLHISQSKSYQYQKEVNKELPKSIFYIPEG